MKRLFATYRRMGSPAAPPFINAVTWKEVETIDLHFTIRSAKGFRSERLNNLNVLNVKRSVQTIRYCHDLAASAGSKFFAAKEFIVRFGDRVVGIVLHGERFFVEQSIAFLAVPVKAVSLALAPLPF